MKVKKGCKQVRILVEKREWMMVYFYEKRLRRQIVNDEVRAEAK